MAEPEDDRISRVAALKEPARRALYDYVIAQGRDISRDEAAEALGMSRALAAFHLDRLVEGRLLETTFRRLSGKSGPGAGRPSKLYRRVEGEVSVSLPPREYELAAQLLAQAIERLPPGDAAGALHDVADQFGRRLGADAAAGPGETPVDRAVGVLRSYGYEPFEDEDGVIRLHNCPFHALSQSHRELVCGMNLCLMKGLTSTLELDGLDAVLEPQPGRCCVAFRRTAT